MDQTDLGMKMKRSRNIVKESHAALAEVLGPGDLAVDLTVGNGRDTLFLYNAVGPQGCVIGFDIQERAVQSAAELLKEAGAEVRSHITPAKPPKNPWSKGVHLVLADHARWGEYVTAEPKGIIANLGYLPGSDHGIVTAIDTTTPALETALDRLSPGGRLAVVCYVGHPGGREEAQAAERLFSGQAERRFRILRVSNELAEKSPFLLVAEKVN